MRRTVMRLGLRRGRERAPALYRPVALGHAAYYVATGVWPLVHIESFEAVTGPKVERWLVKTVGTLVTVIGGAIGAAGWRRRLSPEVALLAVGAAAGLAAIDVVYVARRRIRPIYLADAAAEAALIAAWIWLWRRRERPSFVARLASAGRRR